jgi:hypothetical protein
VDETKARNAHRILIGNRLGNSNFGNQEIDGEDNIKTILREIGCEGGKWMELTRDHVIYISGVEPLGFDTGELSG